MRGRWLILFVLVVTLDQLTKWLAVHYLKNEGSVPIIPNLFSLTLVYNPGAAFGLFSMWPDTARRISLAIVSLVALVIVIRFMLNDARHDPVSQLSLAAVLAGAVGNIIDRFRLDRVIDFLDLYHGNYHWPAFNVADSAISLGVALLLVRMVCCSPAQCAKTE